MTTDPDAIPQDDLDRAIADEIERAKARGHDASTRSRAGRRQHSEEEADYHLARLLILINAMAGVSGTLRGLTKLAKLDFLLRYPVFLERLSDGGTVPGLALSEFTRPTADERRAVESRMIRYKYGPWDDKYYSLIGALVGRGLAEYGDDKNGLSLRLTRGGRDIARLLANDPAWAQTSARCKVLSSSFKRVTGNRLKELIYDQLPDAVDRPYWMEI